MKFDPDNIHLVFENIREGVKPNLGKSFILSAEKGDIAEIHYLEKGEWRIFVDNFPGQKKFYSTNFPMKSNRQFMSDLKRVGVVLTLKKVEKKKGKKK